MWLPIALTGWWLLATLVFPVVVVIAILSAIDEDDDDNPSGIATAIWLAAVVYAIGFTPYGAKVTVPILLWSSVGYVLVGMGWSFKKWYTLVVQRAAKAAKDKYVTQPKASQHKQLIITWMMTWPFSMSWWVLTWPRQVFVWAYERLSTVYDRISDNIWKNVTQSSK